MGQILVPDSPSGVLGHKRQVGAGDVVRPPPGGAQQLAGHQQIRYQDAVKLADGSVYWMDEYDGPRGMGYIVREERVISGVTERMATDYGPEGRSRGWEAFSRPGIVVN